MIRDSLSGYPPFLDEQESANRLADPCELCGFRHGVGRPCLEVRVVAPGESGQDAQIDRWADRYRLAPVLKAARDWRRNHAQPGNSTRGARSGVVQALRARIGREAAARARNGVSRPR